MIGVKSDFLIMNLTGRDALRLGVSTIFTVIARAVSKRLRKPTSSLQINPSRPVAATISEPARHTFSGQKRLPLRPRKARFRA